MKKFLEEFKAFAIKGNAMSMAVGVIIGAAFQNIVTALTNSFINPLIQLITGGSEEGLVIGGKFTIAGVDFDYGAFLTAVVNFLIMAFVLFLLIKAMNKVMELGKKKEEEKPKEPPKPTKDQELLMEIRDLLKGETAEDGEKEKEEAK